MNATTPKDAVVAFLGTQGRQAQSVGGFGVKPETIHLHEFISSQRTTFF